MKKLSRYYRSAFIREDSNLIRKNIEKLINDVAFDNEKTKNEAQLKLGEINQILENTKSASLKVGVSSHGAIFKEEAIYHEAEAKNWMGRIIWMLVVTGLMAIGLFFLMFNKDFQDAKINPWQYAISKIIILSIFFIGLSICTKNYKAHKHNAILNKHRQNALSTFETFVKAGSDEQTKNAVLMQTTQSIFASQNTGYNSVENDSDVSSKIVEIVKSSKGSGN